MGLFDSFLDTASNAFGWLNDNKAALDLISGAAKGYGAYLDYRNQKDQMNMYKKQYEDQERRYNENTKAPNAYNNAVPLSGFQATQMLSGNMADAMKAGVQ